METAFHDAIEEYHSEDIMSVNHSKIIHRLSVGLDQFVAVEIQSPKQATTDLTSKMNLVYFSAGVQSVWIIIPPLQMVQVRTPDGRKATYTEGIVNDLATGIEVPFDKIFR